MPAVSFSGIASGIDTDALITATLDAARATKVAPNERKKAEISDQNDALLSLKTKLTNLQDAIQPFRAINGGGVARSATSSDDSVATATASSGTSNGSYSITVSQLAEPGRVVFPSDSTTRASSSTALGVGTDGNVSFTFNPPLATTAVTRQFAVTSTTTMGDFASSLNSDSEFASYADATLVNVGTPTVPAYRLVVTSKKTGEGVGGNVIDFETTNPPTDLPVAVLTDTPTESDGQNSRITIAGIGSDIERATNDLTDIITGLSISLKDTGTTKITIGVDVTATTTRIKDFLEAYNNVIAFMQENNLVERQENGKEVTNSFGALAKTSLDENLMSLIRTEVSAARSTSGTTVKIFSDMGITTDSGTYNAENKTGGGTLRLDSDSISSSLQRTLANALAEEPDSVGQLLEDFGEAVGNPTTGTIAQFVNFNRLLDTTINSNKSQISDLDARIGEAEKSLARQEELLKQRYARLESLMGSLQSKGNALTSALSGLR